MKIEDKTKDILDLKETFCGMKYIDNFKKTIDSSFWREVCEKYGNKRRILRGEYFVHSGEIMRNVGWVFSGSFKYSLTTADGVEKTVGFITKSSILADYESVMFSKEMKTDIIALQDSDVIVAPANIMRDWLLCDPTLHTKFIQDLFEQFYSLFLDIYRFAPEQRYLQLLKRYPHIMNSVPFGELASYLNISQRRLQKIRDNMVSMDTEQIQNQNVEKE